MKVVNAKGYCIYKNYTKWMWEKKREYLPAELDFRYFGKRRIDKRKHKKKHLLTHFDAL